MMLSRAVRSNNLLQHVRAIASLDFNEIIARDCSWISSLPQKCHSSSSSASSSSAKTLDTHSFAEAPAPKAPHHGCGKLAFMLKPCSLALPHDSKLRYKEPEYKGFQRLILRLLLYYSKESTHIRHANVLYSRITDQVDKSDIYDTFSLDQCFRTTFSLLILHMWLFLSRLRAEGQEGVQLGQYLYEIYNHDLELRVSKAGVNLLLTRWMKDLEKIFYGNIAAYDAAMKPEAGKDDLRAALWRNIYSDGDTPIPNGWLATPVQALERYARREHACLALTDKEALFSGNLVFTSVKSSSVR